MKLALAIATVAYAANLTLINEATSDSSSSSSSTSGFFSGGFGGQLPVGANYTYSCLDIGQTICGKKGGVSIKYPTIAAAGNPWSNVSAFDSAITGLFTQVSAGFATQCGLASADISTTQYVGFFCNQLFNATFNTIASQQPAKDCNGGQEVKVQPICKSACLTFFTKTSVDIFKSQGCTNQTAIDQTANADFAADACKDYPETDCTDKISSASSFAVNWMMIAVVSTLLLNWM